jgi:propionyl-CoA carboxylase alpha chain
MRTAREMDISTVAVYSDPDAEAPFVSDADEAVHLPGDTPSDTYLRPDLLVAAALASGADAVHPGYGFLSERAEFAVACEEAGLVFVGPSARVIESMGSKTAAKALMAAAGVPVLAGIVIDDDADLDPQLPARADQEVGFPLLVKAVFGGGGRGMRVVHDAPSLLEAVTGAAREARSAFGNGAVFLEHYVDTPRHIEVQIFGDSHGQVVSLFERECSIQRRYQKVIEEAPSPVVDDALRDQLGRAAVAAGTAIGYVGAGTVEFVLDAERRFYFLEVNTRLQVEHPVTEMVTGLDLVRVQLRVAEGEPLPDEVVNARISGHAIEVRLYAEDVDAGFLPSAGTIHHFSVPDLPGVRVDAGIASGSVVSVHYDPMLAKVIAHGSDRDQARRRLARALDGTRVHGVPTNRALLAAVLREPQFAAGAIDTGYFSRHDPTSLSMSRQHPLADQLHALVAALAGQAERRSAAPVLATLPSGWRNVASDWQRAKYQIGDHQVEVGYRLDRAGLGAEVNGEVLGPLTLHAATGTHVDLEVGGVRREFTVRRFDTLAFVDSPLGSTTLAEELRFPEADDLTAPGSLVAPMPGTVVRVSAEEGAHVAGGAALVVLEAMKMEHTMVAPYEGTVTQVCVVAGQSVDVGTVLAVVTGADQTEPVG